MKQGDPLHYIYKEHPHKGAENHNAFQRQVDDAAALGKHTSQRHDHQRNGVKQGLLDQKRHARSPPFSAEASSMGLSSFSPSGADCDGLSFLRLASSIFMSREKALR